MEKMFVHVAKKSTFTSELQEQYTNSIVFIKDSQEIYTHGTFYAIPDSYKGKITSLESAVAALQAAKAFSKVSDGTNVAESPSHDGTLKFNKGSNVNITVGTDGVTISATDTKYTQGSGISIEGTTINHSNSVAAGTAKGDDSKTLAFGGTFTIPSITYDAQGHVTAKGITTMTMPAAPSFTNWQAKNIVGASATATANAVTTNTTTFLNLIENGAVRSSHQITGTGKVTVTADATGKVTINGAATTAASGSANGTIAIDGVNVAVKGLGSAAYTASTAYATAAQGTKADNAVPKTTTVNGHALSDNVTVTKADVGLGNVTNESKATMFTNAALTGTPTAPTASGGTNTTQIATTAFVINEIGSKISAAQALRFKGTIGTDGDVTELPANHTVGDTYVVKAAGNFAGEGCEAGDMIICVKSGTTAVNADWSVIQRNLDGAVTGKSLTANTVILGNGGSTVKALANGTAGYVLKATASGPAWQAEKDTVYNHPAGGAPSKTSGFYKFSTDSTSHIASVTAVTKADIIALGIPGADTNTTYTFAGRTGGFTVTPSGGNAQTVSIGKPATAGAADTAAKWATARTITVSGGVTGSVSLDGSANVTLATTLANLPSNKVTAMTGYTKPSDTGAIAAGDSLNAAIGKLEAAWDWVEL
mgnify:CR=1 FL=1